MHQNKKKTVSRTYQLSLVIPNKKEKPIGLIHCHSIENFVFHALALIVIYCCFLYPLVLHFVVQVINLTALHWNCRFERPDFPLKFSGASPLAGA